VTTDLTYFDLIVPCGIQSVTMTSVERELPGAEAPTLGETAGVVAAAFGEVFSLEPRDVGPLALTVAAR
jgi:lipoate-protein ligase B